MLILWHSLQRSRHLGTSGALYIQNKVKMWKCRFKILNSKFSAKSNNFNVFHYKSMWMMLAKIRDTYIALDRVWIPIGTTVHTFSLKSLFSSYQSYLPSRYFSWLSYDCILIISKSRNILITITFPCLLHNLLLYKMRSKSSDQVYDLTCFTFKHAVVELSLIKHCTTLEKEATKYR